VHEILRICLPMFKPKDRVYRWGQIVSSCAYSLGHGTNDAQKTAGIIFLILVAGGILAPDGDVPYWVALVSFFVMGLGTLAGGWKIINTMAFEITDLKPRGGFAAETAGATMLFTASALGVPVSTTHTITGAIVGVGTVDKKNPVNWAKLKTIFTGWIFTIPIAAIISASMYIFIELLVK
jgi:PiT family inorganic phosphate transporter